MESFLIFVLAGIAVSSVHCGELCDSSMTYDCVREYFSKNSDCSLQDKSQKSVFYKENLLMELASVNATVVTTQTELTRLDQGKVIAFFYDESSGNLVLTIDFSENGVYCDAPDTLFAFHQEGGEPIVTQEYVNATYPVIINAVIPVKDGLNKEAIEKGNFSASFPTSDAPLYMGPKVSQSDIPAVQSSFEAILDNIPTVLLEIFLLKAQYFFKAWLQSNICNYDLKPVYPSYDTSIIESIKRVDNEKEISEPCAQSDDFMACVNKFFADHGSCSAVSASSASDETTRKTPFICYVPFLNSSITLFNDKVTGLSGKIEKFAVNKKTNNLLIAVNHELIEENAPKMTVYHPSVGDLPKTFSGYTVGNYPITMTYVINLDEDISTESLEKAFISIFFREPPYIKLSSEFTQSQDDEPVYLSRVLAMNQLVVSSEYFIEEKKNIMRDWISNQVCTF